MKDDIYSKQYDTIPPFQFDERVVNAFDDMISRSVPFYTELQTIILRLLNIFLKPNAIILDCGCSTGTSIQTISKAYKELDLHFIGLDNSIPMLDKARQNCTKLSQNHSFKFLNQDLNHPSQLAPHTISLLILTLQFISPEKRKLVLNQLSQACAPDGCLILVEKISVSNHKLHEHYIHLHHGFKKDQGYSDLEIAQKRESIETTLQPLPLETNLSLLHDAGYKHTDIFFKWLNFVGIIAHK